VVETDSRKGKDPSTGIEPESEPDNSSVVVAVVEAVAAGLESGDRVDVDECHKVAEGSSAGPERQS